LPLFVFETFWLLDCLTYNKQVAYLVVISRGRLAVSKTNAAFMSGVQELLSLRLLFRKEMYGYELVKSMRLGSLQAINLAERVV